MTIDSGSTAWILISGALATLVAPGFGLFFGGMADKKNILTTIAYCILIFSTAVIAWALLGFSFAFGNSTVARGFIGDCSYCWLKGISITA
jgi:Amt family ammonium transporter